MIADELVFQVKACMGHLPTTEQELALRRFALFLTDRDMQSLMLLRGSAGTGKTTLAAAIVKALGRLKQKMVLMAPTGRAAKVFANYAGHAAYTIHRRIYRQKVAGDTSAFSLNANLHTDTLFLVDEASMISRSTLLLDDLIRYVYEGRNCRLMLIGDNAQLPPVGEDESPALVADVLRGYGLSVFEADLCQVLRQSRESGILYNATRIRDGLFRIRLFADVVAVSGDELIETLAASYSRVGTDETMVVCRSNKRANIYNQGIRNRVLDREDELCRGDLLMVVKNNYYWRKDEFIANGDHAVVQRIRNSQHLYGFRFAEVTMTFPDYDDYEQTAIVVLDTLTSEAPALTQQQQEQLYREVMADYGEGVKGSTVVKDDRFFNALQVKYGYAVTCHKAQGGQWAHVYVDQGYMTDGMLTPDYVRWLYTALTRATEKVFLVNWPEAQLTRNG